MMEMTPDRLRVLSYLAGKWATAVPPTAREVAIDCGERARASDWAQDKLRSLHWHGMVATVGVSAFGGGRTWRITEVGRAALAQGIEARSGETVLTGSTEGESPVANGDAP